VPVNAEEALAQWTRYQFVRDHGHADYVDKANTCEHFFAGQQWDQNDLALLKAQKRPALTINKILSTIGNVMGEQIQNRSDISFRPRSGAPNETADILTKVFRQIADSNQLDWKRSDMFADGAITSRGYLDIRLDFTDSMMGEIRIEHLNPKNVLVDPDAEEYDPDSWNDVFLTKWMTWEDIKLLYNAADAELLKNRGSSSFQYGYDSIERERDRFGLNVENATYASADDLTEVSRNIRVIERQHKKLTRQLHFVDLQTGDMRPVPDNWTEEKRRAVAAEYNLGITKKLVKRIRWTVTADNIVLHDDWSPYKHYTIIPYFPYFRRGRTVGLVENLLGPQEYLNKVTSQELHVINTTANSGWVVSAGKLRNMTIEELEQRGAETGLVMEVEGAANEAVQKINPNQVPSGLDRLSYKAEEHIKSISGVSDYQTGQAREDVSAKAVQLNQNRGALNLGKPMDSLQRTDHLIARNVLNLVQEFYTEPRILNIVSNRVTGETEQVEINQIDPQTGDVLNDLTIGEYDVVVSSTPQKETMEDSQFEQAVGLRELGVQLPDEILIENSRLNKRGEIVKQMNEAKESTEAQYKAQIEKMAAELELAKTRAEATRTEADAELKSAKAQMELLKMQQEMQGDPAEAQRIQAEMMAQQQELQNKQREAELEFAAKQREMVLDLQEMQQKLQMMGEKHDLEQQMKQEKHELALEHQEEQNDAKVAASNTPKES